jgi:tRNA nucleotidyltransferase (CCA-adding enzyme)
MRELIIQKPEREQTGMHSIPPQAIQALDRLHSAGYEAYPVGGCVRDLLLGVVPKDWDITTNAAPQAMRKVFADYKTVETGLRHGTLTVLIAGLPLEITTYRIDGEYKDNRRPARVTFTESLREDLARRDFTVNAIAMDRQGETIDYFGGAADLKSKLVRCVGDPGERFREDGLRILRALRFASVLGFSVERRTREALFDNKALLRNLSAERINAELTSLLCGPAVKEILKEYAEILGVVVPEILPCVGFNQRNPHHVHDVWGHSAEVVANIEPTPLLRWTALLHDIGKPQCFTLDENGVGHAYKHAAASGEIADGIMDRLKFDNRSRSAIKALIDAHMDVLSPSKAAVKRLMHRYGEGMCRALLRLKRADNLGQSEKYRYRQEEISACERLVDAIIAENECFSREDLAVDGNDIMALGFEEGPAVGEALNALLHAVMDGNVENKKENLIEYYIREKRG